MTRRSVNSFWFSILALCGVLLIGQDCVAQCDPDPCASIPNAVLDTCTPLGGSCTPADDFACECNGSYSWQDETNTCEEPPPSRIVFVTNGLYGGNLGGLTAADVICTNEAALAALGGGPWRAWLSTQTSSSSPTVRWGGSNIPFRLVNGTLVAQDWADLVDGSLDSPINITATGVQVTSDTYVWTNTDPNGGRTSDNPHECCENWTAQQWTGWYGDATKSDGEWTSITSTSCETESLRLYCFEQ